LPYLIHGRSQQVLWVSKLRSPPLIYSFINHRVIFIPLAQHLVQALAAGAAHPSSRDRVSRGKAAAPGHDPASWGVDADGVTGPQAGQAHDAAALPAAGRLDEIPGLGREAAVALIAEIGLDMSRFPTPEALVSWAELTPTARQSVPRKSRGKKGHGNTYTKRIAVPAAYAAANTDTFLGERFRRLASRPGGGGRKKAGCAVGRSILVVVWHLLNNRAARYRDLGSDWHARHTDRSCKARNAQRQLEASATTSSSPSGRMPPIPASGTTALGSCYEYLPCCHRRSWAAPITGSCRHAQNRGHLSGLRWLFLGQTIRARDWPSMLTCRVPQQAVR
jgi:hypothetical protein